jgi:membrane-associated phospholipid phosphatase
VTEPITADRWLFAGTVPTAWLQAHLCGVPCERSRPPRWYDVALTTVYYSHFFVALIIGGSLWVRDRAGWIGYMRRYVSLTALALVVYILYPMAPPWMAARDGYLPSGVHRITGRGWYDLGHSGSSGGAHQQFSAVGNQVAAMPSLHAALALFVAIYGILRLRSPWRWALLVYPAAMSFALVYYGEHYVVDVLAGFAAVTVVMLGWRAWERRPGGPRRLR